MDAKSQSEYIFVPGFLRFSRAACIVVVILGVIVLTGWALGSQILTGISKYWYPMQPITAASLILFSVSILALNASPSSFLYRAGPFLTLTATLLASVNICEYLFGWNTFIDKLLFHSALDMEPVLYPGRMAPNTAASFMLLGLALLLLNRQPRLLWLSQILSFMPFLIGLTAIVGYAYQEPSFRGIQPLSQMAFHTAAGIILLSISVMFARPEGGLISAVVSDGPGGAVMRRLFPSLIIVTLVSGWIVLTGERAGLYDGPFGMSLFAVLMVFVLTLLLSRFSAVLHRSHIELKKNERERERQAMEIAEMLEIEQEQTEELRSQGEELAAANEELTCINEELEQMNEHLLQAREEAERKSGQIQAFLSSMVDGITMFDADGNIVFMNEAGKEIIGIPKDRLPGDWRSENRWFTLDGDPLPVEQTASHRALNGDPVKDMRVNLVGPTGKSVILSVSSSPVRDLQGRVLGAVNVFRDIREQVDFEKRQDELFKREHNIAQNLQQALVPQVAFEVPGCSVVTRYEPALKEAEVGGDFYDVFEVSEGKIGIVIGDVVGKGLPAAMRVASARYAIRSYSYLDPSPASVITMTNQALCKDNLDTGKMLTAFYAIVDMEEQKITYTSAGHEPPILLTCDGEIKQCDVSGCALGILDYCTYSESEHPFRAGDTLILMTDGITEARIDGTDLFGKERVMDYIDANVNSSLDDLASGLLDAAKEHAGGILRDDAAVLVFKMANDDKAAALEDVTIPIRCYGDLGECRSVTDDFAQRSGFGRQEAWDIVSSVFEACVNALIYGFDESGGNATLCLRSYHDRIEAVIKDSGKGFIIPDSSPIPPPTSPRGRGIPLMRHFMDEVRFNHGNGFTVTLVKKLHNKPVCEEDLAHAGAHAT